MELPEKVTECALDNDGVVCSDPSLIVEIDAGLGINVIGNSQLNAPLLEKVVKIAKKVTKCDTEKCILNSDIVQNVVDIKKLNKNKKLNFKPSGPHNSTNLLSNVNIDDVLENLVHVKKHRGFYHMNFQMMDFNGSPTQQPSELATTNLCTDVIEDGYNCMGVVLNTDTRDGTGLHWFCIFCDFRTAGTQQDPYTIEYFNSSGNPPLTVVHDWMNKAVKQINYHNFTIGNKKRHCIKVMATRIRHQNSETECGPYSLYYIWSRLNKESVFTFRRRAVPDEKMVEFRKHLFG